MIRAAERPSELEKDTLLVVGRGSSGNDWFAGLRLAYPDWTIRACDSYLSAIAEASTRPVRAALACVDPVAVRFEDAVSGLREALGGDAKLVLVCAPDSEPRARAALQAGADDYVLLPLDEREVDAAIGFVRPPHPSTWRDSTAPTASMDELNRLAEVLSGLDEKPTEILRRIAELVREALGARGVTLVMEGAAATSGDVVIRPVLSAPLTRDGRTVGQVSIGERNEGAYAPGDVDKLTRYAALAGVILKAALGQRRLKQLSITDETSGLPNRRHLHAALDDILARARNERFPVTLLIFDVDNFKAVNDALGHDAGDEVIRHVGELFRRMCREQDVVARYGGDEFAVVFWDADGPRVPGSEHPGCALAVLDRVKDALRREPLVRATGTGLSLTISGGLATFPWDGHTRELLIARADEALLTAKRSGKNRVLHFGDPGRGMSTA